MQMGMTDVRARGTLLWLGMVDSCHLVRLEWMAGCAGPALGVVGGGVVRWQAGLSAVLAGVLDSFQPISK